MSPPVKVVRLFSRLNVGGPSVHVVELTAGLRERGYETRLVIGQESAQEGNLLAWALNRGVECERLPALGREIRPLSDLRALHALVTLIREARPQIVHTHTAKAGVLGRLAARLAGVPVLVHTYHGHVLHGYFDQLRSGVFRAVEKGLARVTDALVAVSESVKRDLVRLGVAPPERIVVIPLGLDLDPLCGALPRGLLRRDAGFPEEAPLVGIVGRLVPIKDVHVFLAAAARVISRRPEVRFAVVGDGELRGALEASLPGLGLGGRVFFAGWRRDLPAVYGDLDLVVNSSRNEGTPVALIEAMAAGRPVLATAVGGTPDLLGGGQRGRLVPPGDPRALGEAILAELSQGSAERRTAARAHVLAEHDRARLLADVDRLYRGLLEARGAEPR